MILVIDNYDSFVHNLARYLRRLGCETKVSRNDEISLVELEAIQPDAIVLSPGPCRPSEAGISEQIVREYSGIFPILGICLGHQAIVEALGGHVVRSERPLHGQFSQMYHEGEGLFAGLPIPFRVGRYHSLVAEPKAIPNELHVTGWLDDGMVMAVEHFKHATFGWQFHPESILTDHGFELLARFLRRAGLEPPVVPVPEPIKKSSERDRDLR